MASICCSPPERVPATCVMRSVSRGNSVNTRCRSSAIPASFRRNAPIMRFSRTVRRLKIRRPSGTWPMPRPTTSWGGLPVSDAILQVDPALPRRQQSGDRLERGGLARAVVAEERHDLAARTSSETPFSAWISP